MHLSIIVIVILSVSTSYLCSGAFMHGKVASMQCLYLYNNIQHPTINRNSCPQGWHENQCKFHVCYKDEGETCGSEHDLNRQLKFGKCAKHLMCCEGVCTKWSECIIPHDSQPEFIDFVLNGKRNGLAGGNSKSPMDQLEYDEY